jgi:hypothetical protein
VPSATSLSLVDAQTALVEHGFAFVGGEIVRAWLDLSGSTADWQAFADSWNDLRVDPYMADGGRYRRRRHAVFGARPSDAILRQPDAPHFQSLDYNPLHGGMARTFEPVDPAIGAGPTLTTILASCRALFERVSPARGWRIEVHQFRIEAQGHERGRPTPEGLHRDGVDFVLVLLVARQNIASGTTSIHAPDGRVLGDFTLTAPFDAALVDDRRVAHGVTPVEAFDPAAPAHRDVLVVTFAIA